MELCGTCLSDYVAGMPDGHFSLKTVLLLADQLFPLIRAVHARDFLHRDIKPSNLLMGTGHLSGQAYLLDFGLAKRFRDREKQVHVPYADGKRITGTSRYVSINTHLGIEQSRRDDMESIGYTLVFLAKGSLPWQRVAFPDNGSQSAHEAILQKKLATSYEALCDGLPREFVEYFRIVRALGFEEEPPYQRLRDMFSACFNKLGYVFDGRFDWTDSREVVPRASHKLAVAVHGPSFGDEEVLGKPGEVPIREEPGPLLWNLRRRGDLVASFPKSVARKRVKSAKR
jgi:serine/threonine protein kinase